MGDCRENARIATATFGFKVAEPCALFNGPKIAKSFNPVRRVCNTNLPLTGTDPGRWQLWESQGILTATDFDLNSFVRWPFRWLFVEGGWDNKTTISVLCHDGTAI